MLSTPTQRNLQKVDLRIGKSRASLAGLMLIVWTISGVCLFAQMNTGTVQGIVKDTSGAVIPGAKVTVINLGTRISTTFETEVDGSYVVPYLIPGTYEVTVEKEGFKKNSQTGIVLQVDQKLRVDFTLEIGEITESVTVTSLAPLVKTESSEMGQVIASQKMVELPLNTRDFARLVSLNAGAMPGRGGLGGAVSIVNTIGVSDNNVNGLPVYANNFQIDGVTANQDFYGTLVVNPSIDAIQEFKVTNNNYAAEYGRAGGANIQIAIKSGTNEFHGVAFEFLRNSALDANDFFSNRAGRPIPPLRQNQFGGNLAGPIKKDKTFFFGNYEGFRNRLGQTAILTVPTALQREGIFTEVNPTTGLPQAQIFDPFTRQPFANNTIPASMLNQASANIMKLVPLPNLFGPNGQSLLFNNYFGSNSLAHDIDKMDIRVDHKIGDRDQFFTRYSLLSSSLDNPPFLGVIAGGDPPLQGFSTNRSQNLVISEVHTFSAHTLNEFRFGLNRFRLDFFNFDNALRTSDEVGIPGINNACGYCLGLSRISIAGMSPLGHSSAFAPTLFAVTQFQYVDNMTFIRGKHTMKVGADIRRFRDDLFGTSAPVGIFNFNQNFTSNSGTPGTGIGLAGFLLGYYFSGVRQIADTFPASRGWQLFFFGQDDFRVSPSLTLNLGLRYELYPPHVDRHNNLANFDLATGDMLLGCIATSCTGGIHTDWGLWQPRLGFSWSPDRGKTAIRSSFGMSAYSPAFGGQVGTLQQNYPFIRGQISVPPNVFEPGPSIDQGFPPRPPVEQRPGAAPGHVIPVGGAGSGVPFSAVFWMDPHGKMPRVYQWTINLQRSLTPNLLVDVAYVGNAANNVFVNLPGNVPRPGSDPSGKLTLQQRRPYYSVDPMLGQFTKRANAARSAYHSFQLKVEKRFSQGLSFLASYTESKTLERGTRFIDPDNHMVDRAPAIFDTPQRLVFSYAYQLPFGRGRTYGKSWNRALDAILGGWQVSGITSYMSGFPFQPGITSTLDNGYPNAPNRICSGELPNPTIERWYDTNCFVSPPLNVFGNMGFGILRGPGFRNWDVAALKNFAWTEQRYIQFRAEVFNFPNNVNFGIPNAFQCGGLCGEGIVTSLAPGNTPRQLQFALKFYF